jgi:hypothetical protein
MSFDSEPDLCDAGRHLRAAETLRGRRHWLSHYVSPDLDVAHVLGRIGGRSTYPPLRLYLAVARQMMPVEEVSDARHGLEQRGSPGKRSRLRSSDLT